MTDNKTGMATPHAELIAELMNSNNPKTEREHAAVREIERLREALAQPEQEPVAWGRYPRYTGRAQLREIVFKKPEGKDWLELYAHPPHLKEKNNG